MAKDLKHAIIFDPKNRSAEITYEELAQTMEIGDAFAELPKQCPVQPGRLIMDICSSIKSFTNMEPIIKPIVVREQYCQVSLNAQKEGRNELQLSDYLIKRLVTKILIPKTEFINTPDEMSPGIAITYINSDTVKGMQLAFGETVSVCDNLTAFGKFHYSTYGNDKISFEEGLQLMHHWLQNFGVIHKQHVQTVEMLKSVDIGREKFHEIVGSLFSKAVLVNNGNKLDAPMNQTQVGAMVGQGFETLTKEDDFTGWDLMNWGTHVLKPHTADMVDLLKITTKFNDFVLDELDIPRLKFEASKN